MLPFIKSRIITRNYLIAKLSFHLSFALNSRGARPLVIFTMGKVGSSTLRESLKASNLSLPVFQIHVLTPAGIRWEARSYFDRSPELLRSSQLPRTRHLIESQYLIKALAKIRPSTRWKVITLVRDPVARNISAFFQTLERRIPDLYPRYAAQEISIQDLSDLFLDRSSEKYEAFNQPFTWFSQEFEPALKLDLFASVFPHSLGYHQYQTPLADILVIRLEDLEDCAQKAFQEFLPGTEITLVRDNIATRKKYHSIYQDFFKALTLTPDYLDEMYDDRYVRYFYSAAEIDSFKKKWGRWTGSASLVGI